jgi:secretion/DNA translocation related CpaE-like protein
VFTVQRGAVLLVTGDGRLREQICTLAERSGVEPDVLDAGRVLSEQSAWVRAELVIIGADAVGAIADLPGRQNSVVVADGMDDPRLGGSTAFAHAVLIAVLPAASAWLADRLAAVGQDGERRAAVVVVAAGRGGAGASVAASSLALSAAERGARVLLLDVDERGSGLDLVLGMEEEPGVRWPGLVALTEPVPATELLPELPALGGLSVVSVGRDPVEIPGPAVSAVLSTAKKAVDLIVVDVARGGSEATVAACEWATHGLLVVPAEARAAVSAAAVGKWLQRDVRDLRLLVRGPAPAGMDPELIARVVGLPLAGSVRAEPGLEVALEHGDLPRPRGPLRRFCSEYLNELGVAA